MPDFNAAEILVLAVIAVIIFGPDKLPELARKTARVFNYIRGIANDAKGQLREQLGPEYDDIRLSDLNPRNLGTRLLGEDTVRDLADVKQTAAGATSDLSRAVTDAGAATAGAAAPAAVDAQPAVRRVAFDPEAT